MPGMRYNRIFSTSLSSHREPVHVANVGLNDYPSNREWAVNGGLRGGLRTSTRESVARGVVEGGGRGRPSHRGSHGDPGWCEAV